MRKKLSEITRKEWIIYQWLEISTQFGDNERIFLKDQERTPDEAMQAAEEWDFLQSVKEETKSNEEIES